jgi:hypothetical protein
MGGNNGSAYISTVTILDVSTNTWRSGPNLATAAAYASACLISGS